MVLIEKYFAQEIRQTVREHSAINCQSTVYSRVLLATQERPLDYPLLIAQCTPVDKVRDQGFRKAIVQLYDHRCAICGIKMLTLEGHTVVDAAHIKPWSESHNDSPTNGMALCKLCHWSFDEGLMSVDDSYQVLISPAVRNDPNLPGHMLTLTDRAMFLPLESKFCPDQENFGWHRKERFRKSG